MTIDDAILAKVICHQTFALDDELFIENMDRKM